MNSLLGKNRNCRRNSLFKIISPYDPIFVCFNICLISSKLQNKSTCTISRGAHRQNNTNVLLHSLKIKESSFSSNINKNDLEIKWIATVKNGVNPFNSS